MSIVAASALLLTLLPAARAETFDLTATLSSGSVTGTVTIDTTAGRVTGGDLVYDNPALDVSDEVFATFDTFVPFADYELATLSSAQGGEFFLYFPTLIGAGYTGGPLCTTASECGAGYATEVRANEGSAPGNLISATAAVLSETQPPPPSGTIPEPESLALFAAGLLGIAGAKRRRRETD
jgi:hypothetical protein